MHIQIVRQERLKVTTFKSFAVKVGFAGSLVVQNFIWWYSGHFAQGSSTEKTIGLYERGQRVR